MAQSRMAGMAMDLGPDDLADVGEAATLATNKMGMEQGQQAGVLVNLDRGGMYRINDGNPEIVVHGHGKTERYPSNKAAYPVSGPKGYSDVIPLSNSEKQGFAQMLFN